MTTSVVGKPKVINWPPRRPTTVGLRALPSIHFLPFPRRYEVARYVHLVDTKFTKWSNFVREAWLIKEKWNKRSCLKPPMNADARRCSAPLIGVDRRASAVPYPRRYEVCSLGIADCGFTSSTVSKVRNSKLAIGNLKSW